MPINQWLRSSSTKSKRKYESNEEEDDINGELDYSSNIDYYPKVAVGYEYNGVVSIESSLKDAAENSLNFVCVPLFHPRYRRYYNPITTSAASKTTLMRTGPITRSDMCITNNEWMSSVIGSIMIIIIINYNYYL